MSASVCSNGLVRIGEVRTGGAFHARSRVGVRNDVSIINHTGLCFFCRWACFVCCTSVNIRNTFSGCGNKLRRLIVHCVHCPLCARVCVCFLPVFTWSAPFDRRSTDRPVRYITILWCAFHSPDKYAYARTHTCRTIFCCCSCCLLLLLLRAHIHVPHSAGRIELGCCVCV